MARHTLDELETILLNLLHQLEHLNLEAIDWENLYRLMEHWDQIIDLLNRLDTFPWDQIPPSLTPPTVNQYTMVRHPRIRKASIEAGGRFEASHLLRGLVVLCIDEEPQSLYYCTGTKWLRVSSGNRLTGSYGYITDETPLGYIRGDLIEIPVSKLEPVSGVRDDIGMGMQITDAYHAVGIVIMIRTLEFYPELAEDMALIATWIGEPDGTNLYTNNEGDPGGFIGGGNGGSGEVEYDYDRIARRMAATALDSVNYHLEDFDNPHRVTAEQIGLDEATPAILSTLQAFKNRAAGFATAAQGEQADNAVLLTEDQNISGLKTFAVPPLIPAAELLPANPSNIKPATEAQVAAAVRGTDLPGGFANDDTNDSAYEKYHLVARYTSCTRMSHSFWYRDYIKMDFSLSARASGLHEDYTALGIVALEGADGILNHTKQLYFGDIAPGAGEFLIVQKEKTAVGGKRIVYEFYMHKHIIGVDSNVCFLNIGNFLYYSNDGDARDVFMEVFRSYEPSQGTDSIPIAADETILTQIAVT